VAKKKRETIVSIMGIPFKFEYVDKISSEGEHLAGITHPSDRKIQVSTKDNESAELRESTALHEIIHGILYVTGQSELLTSEQEESIVVAIEHGLHGIVDFKEGILPEA